MVEVAIENLVIVWFLYFHFFLFSILTAILHRGLRNGFFFFVKSRTFPIFYLECFVPFLYGLFNPFSIFFSIPFYFFPIFYLDFHFISLHFIFFFSFWTFLSFLRVDFYSSFFPNRGQILNFSRVFYVLINLSAKYVEQK